MRAFNKSGCLHLLVPAMVAQGPINNLGGGLGTSNPSPVSNMNLKAVGLPLANTTTTPKSSSIGRPTLLPTLERCVVCSGLPSCPPCSAGQICTLVPADCTSCAHAFCTTDPGTQSSSSGTCGSGLICGNGASKSAATRGASVNAFLLLAAVLIFIVPAALAQSTSAEAVLPTSVTMATNSDSTRAVHDTTESAISGTSTTSLPATSSTTVPVGTSTIATPSSGPCNGFACPNGTTTSAATRAAGVNKLLMFGLALVLFASTAFAQVSDASAMSVLSTSTTTTTRTKTVSTVTQGFSETPAKAVTLLPIGTLPPATAGIPGVTTVTVAPNPNAGGGGYRGNCANGLVCGEPYSGGSRSAAVPSARASRMLLLLALLIFLVPPALGQVCSVPNTNTLPSDGQQSSPSTSDSSETAEHSVEVVSRLPTSLPLTEPVTTYLEPSAVPSPVTSTPGQTSIDASCADGSPYSSDSSSLITTATVGSESLLVPKTTAVVAQGTEPTVAATAVDTTTPLWTEVTLNLDQTPNMTCDNFGATISAGLWLCPGNGTWVRSEAGKLVFPKISLALAILFALLLPAVAAQRASTHGLLTSKSANTMSLPTSAIHVAAPATNTVPDLHQRSGPLTGSGDSKEPYTASHRSQRRMLIGLVTLVFLPATTAATSFDTVARDDTLVATDAALVCERKRPWTCHWVPDQIRATEGIRDEATSGSPESAANVLSESRDKSEDAEVAIAEGPTRVNFTKHDPTWVYNPFTPPPHTHQWTSSSAINLLASGAHAHLAL